MMTEDHKSPMFLHALESFEEGIHHYLKGEEKDRKFAFLHLDHAVELLLKEKTIRLGKSIYKTDGTTLNIHEVFKSLGSEKVQIPEWARLEEVHDYRNNIQHKGLVPDKRTTEFNVKLVYKFVKRFLEEELDAKVEDHLPMHYLTKMEGIKETITKKEASEDFKNFISEYRLSSREDFPKLQRFIYDKWNVDPGEMLLQHIRTWLPEKPSLPDQNVIVSSFVILERVLEKKISSGKVGKLKEVKRILESELRKRGTEYQELNEDISKVLAMRNSYVHKGEKFSKEEIIDYLSRIIRIFGALGVTGFETEH